MDWNKLAKDSNEMATFKGWNDSPRPYSEMNILFHTELAEATEDYRRGRRLDEVYFEADKPCGIPIEFADFIIRIAQHCGQEKLDLEQEMLRMKDVRMEEGDTIKELLAEVHALVGDSWRAAKCNEVSYLANGIALLMWFSKVNNINIEAAIHMNAQYNAGRPHRHGGKLI